MVMEQFFNVIIIFDINDCSFSLCDEYFWSFVFVGLGQVYEYIGSYEKSVKVYLQVVDLCECLGMLN